MTQGLLVLFDIDGTLLLRATADHREAMHAALREVFGVDAEGVRFDPAGRTDGEIARQILLARGVDAKRIDAGMHELHIACCRAYAERPQTDLSDAVAPGVPEMLERLAARDDVRLALLTGNYEPVARLKLRRAGIGGFFPSHSGAYGSDSEDRTMLPEMARRRAGDGAVPWPRERTVVVGDTPRDIACARADGVRCIAVATGPYEAADLADADAVVDDARGVCDVLEEWLGPATGPGPGTARASHGPTGGPA